MADVKRLAFLALLALCQPISYAHEVGVFYRLNAHSGATSIWSLNNDWQGRWHNADALWLDQRIGAYVEFKWPAPLLPENTHQYTQMGWIKREVAYAEFTPDTGQFVWALEQKGRDIPARNDLNLNIKAMSLNGVFLRQRMQLEQHQITAQISGYGIDRYQVGQLSGVSETDDRGALGASSQVDYWFDNDYLLDYRPDAPNGWGYSVDMAYRFATEHWRMAVEIRDVINRFYLQGAGHTRACVGIGAVARPVCDRTGAGSGISEQADYSFALPAHYRLSSRYDPWRSSLSWQHIGRIDTLEYRYWLVNRGNAELSLAAGALFTREQTNPLFGVRAQQCFGAWCYGGDMMLDQLAYKHTSGLMVSAFLKRTF